MFDIIVVGGGTSGALAALQCSNYHPKKSIALFERRKQLLVNYIKGVNSQTTNRNRTREQLLKELANTHVQIYRSSGIESIRKAGKHDPEEASYVIQTRRAAYHARNVIVASGKDPDALHMIRNLGLKTCPIQPAAFPLRSEDSRLRGIRITDLNVGLSWVKPGPLSKRIQIQLASALPEEQVLMKIEGDISIQSGKLTGTGIHELTKHIAKQHEDVPEHLKICVNWLPDYGFQGILEYMQLVASSEPDKTVLRTRIFELPLALWSRLVAAADIAQGDRWQDLLPVQFQELANQLTESEFFMKPDLRSTGISTYRGGVHPVNLHPDRPECLHLEGLYFVGSILDRDPEEFANPGMDLSDHGLSWIQQIGEPT